MKFFANPVMVKMVLLLVFTASLFILGVWLIRRMRKEVEADLSAPVPRVDNAPAFAMAAFQSVIQQLKEKEQELQRTRKEAHERASASENINAAVFTNLETGVVVFNAAGLAQQANPAAREMLGFATISGMHARDLFRGVAQLRGGDGNGPQEMSQAIERAQRDASVFRRLELEYATPGGERRVLFATIAPALGNAGECYGAVCLVWRRTSPG